MKNIAIVSVIFSVYYVESGIFTYLQCTEYSYQVEGKQQNKLDTFASTDVRNGFYAQSTQLSNASYI